MTDNAIVPVKDVLNVQVGIPPAAVPRSIFTMTTEQLQRMKLVAQMCAGSQLAYAKTGSQKLGEGDLFLVMLKGVELGLEPMAALASIDLIQGMPTLDPQGMLALINRSGELEDIQITASDDSCTIVMKRKGRSPHTEVFNLDDADKLGLKNKDNWKKQPRVMLKWRCVAACARVVFPDVIQGLYTQEELGADVDITEDGRMKVVAPPLPAKANGKPATSSSPKGDTETSQTPTDSKPDTANGHEQDDPAKPKYDLAAVKMQVAPLYTEADGKVNTFHLNPSVAKLLEEGVILPFDTTEVATARILMHRAQKDHGLNGEQIVEALNAMNPDDPVTSYKEWRAKGRTVASAWKAIGDYAQLSSLPPATSKGGKKAAKKDAPPAESEAAQPAADSVSISTAEGEAEVIPF